MALIAEPVKDFGKFLIGTCGVITGFFYFIIYKWTPVKELLMKHNFLSFSEEDLFIITPFSENKWYILGALILGFALSIFLMYKSHVSDHSYFPWTMLSLWIIAVLSIIYQLADPVPWYGVMIGLLALCFLVWLLFRVVSNYLKT